MICGIPLLVISIYTKDLFSTIAYGIAPILISLIMILNRIFNFRRIKEKIQNASESVHLVFKVFSIVHIVSALGIILFGCLRVYYMLYLFFPAYFVSVIPYFASMFLNIGLFRQAQPKQPEPAAPLPCKPSNPEIRTDLLSVAYIRSFEEDHIPTSKHLHSLFEVDAETWVYTDSVGIDIRDGKAYFIHNEVRNYGAAYGSELFVRPISYDEVRVYAKLAKEENSYNDLNEKNWRNYIPKELLSKKENKVKLKIDKAVLQPYDRQLIEFYLEIHNVHYHTITFLRKTTMGYRIFYIASRGWNGGLEFDFDRSENMIYDILKSSKYGQKYDACDRLLSETELSFVQCEANKSEITATEKPRVDKIYQIWEDRIESVNSEKWHRFGYTLKELVLNGSDHSLSK